MSKCRRRILLALSSYLAVVVLAVCAPPTSAQNLSPQSTNYRFDESVIGVGGLMDSSSANYRASDSIGSLGVGTAASANYQVIAGAKTSENPVLAVTVAESNANFGHFSAGATSTAQASFSVLNYTSYGYAVYLMGSPLTNGTYSIPSMTTTNISQIGIEQFGLNLVANTNPISFGANLDNGGFGFGQIAPEYAVPNEFRYVSGELVASAPKDSGMTKYTLSYITNVASLTPGGQYSANQTLIVVGTY